MTSLSSTGKCVFLLIRGVLKVYTFITWPIYFLIQKPWIVKGKNSGIRAVPIARSNEEIVYRNDAEPTEIQELFDRDKIDTMEKAFNYVSHKHSTKKALGTREVFAEEDEIQPDGTIFKKLVLGDYQWRSFGEMNVEAENFGRGLIELGLKVKQNIALFSETRAEWLISANGCMKLSMPVVTLYANLGEDALVDGINETEVNCVITSQELLPKFKHILPRTPKVSVLIVMENSLKPLDVSAFPRSVQIHSYSDIVRLGEKSNLPGCPPSPKDIAIIMFTSGSTGPPKGVMLSHHNIVSSMLAYTTLDKDYANDVYMAFLPLAHVLELIAESMCMLYGMPIGYSSPLTMTDQSSKIKQGCEGDATVLKPTAIASVPLMLDRIYKAIQDKIETGPPIKKAIFNLAVQYKLYWSKKGYDTPIINKMIFKPVRCLLGGRLRFILCGGAPLSPDVHAYLRAVLCCPILSGYALTETTNCTAMMNLVDASTGKTGGPLPGVDIKLVNWEEGNYNVNDTPNPRGEIHVGGDNVAVGYYKQPEKTKEDFYEENGRWWFRTGDIGEFTSNGTLKIVDRKKDLVKLQHGEYVSLSKVESELKTCPLVDNICVYADSTQKFVVALLMPNTEKLMCMAQQKWISFEESCSSLTIEKLALLEIQKHSVKCRLEKFEIPRALKLVPDIWTPDLDLVTAAFKLKRKNIQNRYQRLIDTMYSTRCAY